MGHFHTLSLAILIPKMKLHSLIGNMVAPQGSANGVPLNLLLHRHFPHISLAIKVKLDSCRIPINPRFFRQTHLIPFIVTGHLRIQTFPAEVLDSTRVCCRSVYPERRWDAEVDADFSSCFKFSKPLNAIETYWDTPSTGIMPKVSKCWKVGYIQKKTSSQMHPSRPVMTLGRLSPQSPPLQVSVPTDLKAFSRPALLVMESDEYLI